MSYIIGQILGVFSTVCAIARPFRKEKRQILVLNIAVNTLVATNYLLIGQIGSAAALCLVAIIQSVVSMIHDRHGAAASTREIILFAALYVGFGLVGIISAPDFVWTVSFENLLELMPIAGSLMLMASLFAPRAQTARKYLLVNGMIWTCYALAVGSTTFLTSLVSACSAGAALWKYHKKEHHP